jgi:NAD(P)-dependent dehydrogenase (short-subunit alcohol dehydrogenase family)
MVMDKKIAIITGSRQGIGLACAKKLAQEGYFIIVSDIVEMENAAEAIQSIKNISDCEYIKCDISDAAQRENLFKKVVGNYGRIDVLVNNAGVALEKRMDILETTEASFDRLIRINLKGTFFMCQLAAQKMIQLKEKNCENYNPRIINISSISAYTSSISRGEYCISKAGISMTTMLFADRLAEYNIPVFEVRPGIILTEMTQAVKDKYEKLINEGITPVKRFGLPVDVANCVASACSGLLDFSTGQVLNADGGFSIRRL